MSAVAKQHGVETQTIFRLPNNMRTLAVTRACRVALLSFVNGAPRWGKHELAAWLAGPYAEIVKNSAQLVEGLSPRERRAGMTVNSVDLTLIVNDAISFAQDLLRSSMTPEGGAVNAWDAWRRGLIARCEDEYMSEAWVPLGLPDLKLRDRILSLWAADYLASTEEYEAYLSLCEVCESASFDPFLRARGRCKDHSPRQIEVRWSDGAPSMYSSYTPSEFEATEPRSGIHRRARRA